MCGCSTGGLPTAASTLFTDVGVTNHLVYADICVTGRQVGNHLRLWLRQTGGGDDVGFIIRGSARPNLFYKFDITG